MPTNGRQKKLDFDTRTHVHWLNKNVTFKRHQGWRLREGLLKTFKDVPGFWEGGIFGHLKTEPEGKELSNLYFTVL